MTDRCGCATWAEEELDLSGPCPIHSSFEAFTDVDGAGWVERNFDLHPDGSMSAPKTDPRLADRLSRMAEGEFG